jgi:hypothetical protein
MEGALFWLLATWAGIALLAGVGLIPLRHWRGYRADEGAFTRGSGTGFPVVQRAVR